MLGGVWESNKHGEIYIQLRCLGIPRLLRCLETRNGEILHAEQELDNAVDKFAAKVVKNETVGHSLCEYSRILIIARGGRNCKQLCGGMGIPCRLVFSSSTKVKIDR